MFVVLILYNLFNGCTTVELPIYILLSDSAAKGWGLHHVHTGCKHVPSTAVCQAELQTLRMQ